MEDCIEDRLERIEEKLDRPSAGHCFSQPPTLGNLMENKVKELRQQADELECLRNTLPNMIPDPAEKALRRLLQP